jgi:hypothetical protein
MRWSGNLFRPVNSARSGFRLFARFGTPSSWRRRNDEARESYPLDPGGDFPRGSQNQNAALDSSVAAEPSVEPAVEQPMQIAKPAKSGLDAFKSKRGPNIAGVKELQTALPHHGMSAAKDYCRMHPDEANYWSDELCFVTVPIKGAKETLHLIAEDLAMEHLPSGRIQRFRLALAAKPDDIFFLCHVPSQNLDNTWNETNLKACHEAKRLWTQATSRRMEGVDKYKVEYSEDPDAFPEPNWPAQTLDQLIETTFEGRMITSEDHPAFKRLKGRRQSSE